MDYRVYAQDNASGDEIPLWASEGATHSGADKTIAIRNASGQVFVGDPTNADHAANKEYVDSKIYSSEATDNNGAYGASFSDERYLQKPTTISNYYKIPAWISKNTGNALNPVWTPDLRELTVYGAPTTFMIGSEPIHGLAAYLHDGLNLAVEETPRGDSYATSKKYVDNHVLECIQGESVEAKVLNTVPHFEIPLFSDGTLFRGVLLPLDKNNELSNLSGTSFEVYIPPNIECSIHSNVFFLGFEQCSTTGISGYRRCVMEVEVNSSNLQIGRCTLKYFNSSDDISAGVTTCGGSYFKVVGKLVHA